MTVALALCSGTTPKHTAILEGFLLRLSSRAGFVLFVNLLLSDK
jgi:hypothetical protein